MKIALIGTGKTGSKVIEQADTNDEVIEFNQANPPSPEEIGKCDVVVSFVPAEPFEKYIPMLIESGVPVATGSTGVSWPEDLDQKLKSSNISWIRANNFSLGMQLIHAMITSAGKLDQILDKFESKIHEVHHVNKLDKPSGTAISWRKWLGREVDITSERTGDVSGDHKLTISNQSETITLRHEAHNRSIFAQGALLAARMLAEGKVDPGLHNFSDVVGSKQ